MKRVILSLVLALSFANFSLPAASADTQIFNVYSPDDSNFPVGIDPTHKLFIISVSVMGDNPSEIILRAGFKSALTNTSFTALGYKRPQLRFVLSNFPFSQRADVGEFWVTLNSDTQFQGTTPIPAIATTYVSMTSGAAGGRKVLVDCKAEAWLEAGQQTSAVAFKIDRVCMEIPNTFYVNAYLDSDTGNSLSTNDWKFAATAPVYIDMSRLPRPPKMINQTVSFGSSIYTQNLDNPIARTTVKSSMGMPVTVTTLTPAVCTPSVSGSDVTLNLIASGTCTIDAWAPGNSAVNPSPHIQQSFTVNPKVMVSQEIYWDEPFDVQVGDEDFDLYIYSSSKLPVTVTSQTTSVCQFRDPYSNPSMVSIVGSGYCEISVFQAGNDKYYSKSGSASFYVEKAPVVKPTTTRPPRVPSNSASAPKVFKKTTTTEKQNDFNESEGTATANKKALKKTTITCGKGVLTKKVSGTPPKCPSGWKLKK